MGERLVRCVNDNANPITQVFLYPREVADIKMIFSAERILYPFKRSSDGSYSFEGGCIWFCSCGRVMVSKGVYGSARCIAERSYG